MLIEVKARAAYVIDGKPRKKVKTFLLDRQVFAEAEYDVTALLHDQYTQGTVTEYDILQLRVSPIKEVATQYDGIHSYIASLKDTVIDSNDMEKVLRYKVLLWADSINDAMQDVRQMASEGYDMSIEGLREVDYEYLDTQDNGTQENQQPG